MTPAHYHCSTIAIMTTIAGFLTGIAIATGIIGRLRQAARREWRRRSRA
jgi:hypothetical protein